MLTYSQIRSALYSWVNLNNGITGMGVIFADRNAPVGQGLPYLTIKILSHTKIGYDQIGSPDADGNIKVKGNREITVSLNSYGKEGYDALANLEASLEKPTVQQYLRYLGMIGVDTENINDLTSVVGTAEEPRANMDVLFRLDSQVIDVVDLIESIDVAGKYLNDDGTEDFEDNFTIDSGVQQ